MQHTRLKPTTMSMTTTHYSSSHNGAPATLFNVGETQHHFPQQEQAHFVPSGTKLVQETCEHFLLREASNSPRREWARARWKCEHCHCHCHFFTSTMCAPATGLDCQSETCGCSLHKQIHVCRERCSISISACVSEARDGSLPRSV